MKTHLTKPYFFLAVIFSVLIISDSVFAQHKGRNKQKTKKAVVHHKKTHSKHLPHTHYKHHPRRGAVVKSLNAGAVAISFKGKRFHYHNGIFYKANGPKFIVAKAPLGMRVKVLPPKYKRFILGKKTYFYYYGTFYKRSDGANEFEVIDAPVGAVVDAIPEGYETVVVDGVEYHTLDDVKYLPKENAHGSMEYEVVN